MSMKKLHTVFTGILAAAILAGCNSGPAKPQTTAQTTPEAIPAFTPSNNITYNVSSKAGGNSDLITRTMSDICTKEGFVEKPIVVVNNTDGSGNIIRITTKDTKDPNHTLLCFSSGDMQSLLDSDIGLTVDDFAPIAIMAADKQLLFGQAGGKYTGYDDIKAAIDSGVRLNVGGTKSNEKTVFDMFVAEIGAAESFNYMFYDSSAESITALMGGHIDFCMGSPAAAVTYTKSGDIVPIIAFSDVRFSAPLDPAPTMEELGYNTVQAPMWRGVLAPKTMSEEAQQYWSDTFGKVVETDAWQEFLSNYLLSPYYQDLEATREIMKQTQTDYLAKKE